MNADVYRVFALSEDPMVGNDHWNKARVLAWFWYHAVIRVH